MYSKIYYLLLKVYMIVKNLSSGHPRECLLLLFSLLYWFTIQQRNFGKSSPSWAGHRALSVLLWIDRAPHSGSLQNSVCLVSTVGSLRGFLYLFLSWNLSSQEEYRWQYVLPCQTTAGQTATPAVLWKKTVKLKRIQNHTKNPSLNTHCTTHPNDSFFLFLCIYLKTWNSPLFRAFPAFVL